MCKIFIIDDEPDILQILNLILSNQGYEVYLYSEGNKALQDLGRIQPDLILLDLMLPDISGLEICGIIKNNPASCNIIVMALTAKSDEFDIMTGLNLGCDYYITKPFSNSVLIAKIKAALRRENRKNKDNSIIEFENLIMDCKKFEVFIEEKTISLSALEFKTLSLLIKNKGIVFTRSQILDVIKDELFYESEERSVDFLISRLRKKIGVYGKNIESIYGVGYSFKEKAKNKYLIANR